MNANEAEKLYKEFQEHFPIEKLKTMSLEEYTNLDRSNSFCYWLEKKTESLGSIWGGSSYKFGIYKSAGEIKYSGKAKNDGVYAWYAKYGDTKEVAFKNILSNIIEIAEASQKHDFSKIDRIDLGTSYKWKIAYLYSNMGLLNMYAEKGLRFIAQKHGLEDYKKAPISDIQTYLINQAQGKNLFEYSGELWNEWISSDEYKKQNDKELESDEEIEGESFEMPLSTINKTGVIQIIFFGAPGTGKSFKIDDPEKGYGLKNIDEFRKFRTTFHPDYDYAQFVGAYKPQKNQVANKALNKNELTAILKEMKDGNNYPIHKFSALYSDSLLKLSNAEQIEIIKEAGSPESMAVELKKGIAVGEYLKEKIDGGSITYSFVPQVFAKAYAVAWKQYLDAGNVSTANNQVYLVIEEINRGNCAQIFGDIFQLLDRDGDGFSQYSIDVDCDFATWLREDSILKNVWSEYETKVGDGKLKLPPNLNILATMNTSDQSLFPMDSAFKRRFDWEYVPISFDGKDAANYQIDIDGSFYSWKNFVEAVNDKILDLTESEDKQLGEFFIKPDNGNIISKERFLGKVMFYLWNEVCKDEHKNGSFFRAKINDKEDFFTFQDLYKKKDLLKLFMDGLLAPKN